MVLNCYTYWDDAYNMSSIIKYIYDHNVKVSLYYNFKLILITNDNITKYVNVPERFWSLENKFKSEIVRFLILNKYGGIWLNPEIIIIKNLNKLYEEFINSNKKVMLSTEFEDRISIQSIIMLPNTECSNFCVKYMMNTLNTINNIMWDDIAYNTLKTLYESYPELILLKKNIDLVCWNQNPVTFKKTWIKNIDEAEELEGNITNDLNYYYISTSKIYKNNDIDIVFNNNNSIFYYLIKEFNKNLDINNLDNNNINNNNINDNKINYLYFIVFIIILIIIMLLFIFKNKLNLNFKIK
jgi:hypothetical protein